MVRLYAFVFSLIFTNLNIAADVPKAKPTRSDEPLAEKYSAESAAAYLDSVGLHWTRDRKCGACHTNYPYLFARPALGSSDALGEVRKFFENRAANWDTAKPRWDTEVVATAVSLALNDRATSGKLAPVTRQALDRMWKVQQKNGAWNWLKCDWPPMEHDDYFGAVFAAVGVGHAPDNYAQAESAQVGLAKLRSYLRSTPAPDLHHKAWLVWASMKLDGLLEAKERQLVIEELRKIQKPDGSWNLPSLGKYTSRHDDHAANDPAGPGDGYGTGLVTYVLRQAGVAADDPAVVKAADWLRKNQRVSGRWYTRSLSTDKAHYITNAGSAFAVLALDSVKTGSK